MMIYKMKKYTTNKLITLFQHLYAHPSHQRNSAMSPTNTLLIQGGIYDTLAQIDLWSSQISRDLGLLSFGELRNQHTHSTQMVCMSVYTRRNSRTLVLVSWLVHQIDEQQRQILKFFSCEASYTMHDIGLYRRQRIIVYNHLFLDRVFSAFIQNRMDILTVLLRLLITIGFSLIFFACRLTICCRELCQEALPFRIRFLIFRELLR